MFKVLLVDDEPWALFSLENSFEWDKAGFEVVAKTTDPQEALEVIVNQKPDVVFTDIKMDDMTGIELMKKSRELGIESEFVIISAYGEFSFAKDAIKYGVYQYMLKPIDLEEAQNVIVKLAEHLQSKKSFAEVSDLEFIDELLQNQDEILAYFHKNGLEKEYELYQVITVKGKSVSGPEILRFPKYAKNMNLKTGLNKFVYFINTRGDLTKWFQELWENSMQLRDISIGISTVCNSLDHLYQKYREADISISNDFLYRKNGIYSMKNSNAKYVRGRLEELEEAIENKRPQAVNSIMAKLPEEFVERALGMEDITLFYNQFAAYMSKAHDSLSVITDIGFMDYDQLCKKFSNFDDLCKYINQNITRVISDEYSYKNIPGANENFARLLEYIKTNYSSELYLNDIAEKFYLNVSYLSVLFKKATDKTFTEYITDLRMEKAKNLLADTGFTIAQIAEKVGFNDYYYFNKIFKKYFEITPKQFRLKRTVG